MKTLFFEDFRTGNVTLDIRDFLSEAAAQKAYRLEFKKQTLNIDSFYAFQFAAAVSNHGFNGFKKAAFLFENTDRMEIDFCGSEIICDGDVSPFIFSKCSDIILKNVDIICRNMNVLQGRVALCTDEFTELDEIINDGVEIIGGRLYARHKDNLLADAEIDLEYNGTTGRIENNSGDCNLGVPTNELNFERIGDRIRIYGVKRRPPIGNRLVFSCTRRMNFGILCDCSENMRFENINMYSAHGMGIIAQMCENISVDGFNTLRRESYCYSLCADATHFVQCRGEIRVENCVFKGQFDDALNIHGIYTRITDKRDNSIIVREIHPQTKGIKIYREGDRIAALNPKTLIPYAEFTVKNVEYINEDSIRLWLKEDISEIRVGDDIENISCDAELIFRNNRLEFNRARGMLIATRGRVLIENNYFSTSGSAIKFESDGEFWFESGAVKNVTMRNNIFDNCKHAEWGKAVIEFQARTETEEEKYYHGEINICDNDFILYDENAMILDNISRLKISGNRFFGVNQKITVINTGVIL